MISLPSGVFMNLIPWDALVPRPERQDVYGQLDLRLLLRKCELL